MKNNLVVVNHENQTEIELPPGFRFHPTDEELITHYLSKKVLDSNFSCEAIGEVDMNKIEPWDLPLIAKLGECEWYFFSVKERKYPNGLRTNRATAYGYWKATGKDKEIYKGKFLVGMKKTLVFYKGRAPNGVKSNWVTHEYRLEGNISSENFPRPNRNDWVISKVFLKISGRQKVHISKLRSMEWTKAESPPAPFHPTMDDSLVKSIESEVPQVNYVSKSTDIQKQTNQNMVTCLSSPIFEPSGSLDTMASQLQYHTVETDAGYIFSSMNPTEDPPIFKNLTENYGHNINHAIGNQREIVSTSREAAENTEKYTVVSNLDMEKRSLVAEEAPSTPIHLEDLELILDIKNYFY